MKINKKALLLGTMAFVLVAASGMVSAYASGSSGTKKAKVQTITDGVCIGSVDVGGIRKKGDIRKYVLNKLLYEETVEM